MAFGFVELKSLCADFSKSELLNDTGEDSLFERIRQILFDASINTNLMKQDLIPLVRQILFREKLKTSLDQNLRVPQSAYWPTVEEWRLSGIYAMAVDSQAYLLKVQPWHPEWIGDSLKDDVFTDAFSDRVVRHSVTCKADPFITKATGYMDYSCPGQSEAVRAVFLMKPGSTLIVNLPTGSGKSLVGHAPTLVNKEEGHLTIFVVPTTALAIDQASHMENYFKLDPSHQKPWPLAWYSGVSKSDRAEIYRRIESGKQRILFTSPEALATSLLKIIFKVANAGMLDYLVIDEAHIVTQWGDEFRPEFQLLSGIRNSLLRLRNGKNLKTLLMSATLTPETTETLVDLFGPRENVQMISAVHLRPEPQYWFSMSRDREEKVNRICEALRYVPRPFILYVTERKDADDWISILSKIGIKRVRKFDGKTNEKDRQEIILNWMDNKLDGIVATSAFGLGMDKADVRTIIHATIPETLDRFYQEVGRGGRDGKVSISLLIYEKTDWNTARKMSEPKIISQEIGIKRWGALYNNAVKCSKDSEVIKLNIEALRGSLINSNEKNVKWNYRTLNLMCRAKLIQLELEPNSDSEEVDRSDSESFIVSVINVRVRLLRGDHLDPNIWEDEDGVISLARKNSLQPGKKSFKLMNDLLNNNKEMADTLANLYQNSDSEWFTDVIKVCGGCTADRLNKDSIREYNMPIPHPILKITEIDFSEWNRKFDYIKDKNIRVFYEPTTPIKSILFFISWLVGSCGFQELCCDKNSEISSEIEWNEMYSRSKSGVVIYRDLLDLDPYSPLARVSFFGTESPDKILAMLTIDRPMHIMLFRSDTLDPIYPDKFLIDKAESVRLDSLLPVLIQ